MSERAPRVSRTRRVLRWSVRALLIGAIAVMGSYLGRRPLFEQVLIRQLESRLTATLGATVEIDSIGGNWLDTWLIEGIHVAQGGSVAIEAGHVELRIDLEAALRQAWADVVVGARVRANRIHIAMPTGSEPADGRPDANALVPTELFDLLAHFAPAGVRVDVEDCAFASPHGERRGRFSIALEPSASQRRLDALFAGLEIRGFATSDHTAELRATLARPGEMLRAFGLDNELHDGGASIEVAVGTSGEVLATVDVAGVTLAGQALAEEREVDASATLELVPGGRWHARDISVRVPGAALDAPSLALQDPRRGLDLTTLTGRVDARIEDCSQFQSLVPARLIPWLPARGWFDGSVSDNALAVSSGELHWPAGVVARLSEGEVPFAASAGTTRQARLAIDLSLAQPHAFEFERGPTLELVGSAHLEVSGSLDAMSVACDLDLGAGSIAGTSWSTCAGDITLRPDLSATFDLAATGAESSHHNLDVSRLAIAVAGSFEPNPLRVAADASIDEAIRPGRAPLSLRGHVRYADDRLSSDRLSVRGPVNARISGEVETAAGTLHATIEDLEVAAAEVGHLLRSTVPPAQLRGRAELEGPFADPSFELELELELPDATKHIPAGAWRDELGDRYPGSWTASIAADRKPGRCNLTSLTTRIGDAFSLQARGALPISWNGTRAVPAAHIESIVGSCELNLNAAPRDSIREVDGRLEFDWNSERLSIPSLAMSGTLARSNVAQRLLECDVIVERLAAFICGQVEASELAVRGSVFSEPIDLSIVPRSLHPFPALGGTLELAATLDGPIGTQGLSALTRATVSLRDARLKPPGPIPTVEDLAVEVELGPEGARLGGGSATLGAGALELAGSMTYDGWQNLASADIELDIRGEDILLLRKTGLKLRASPALEIRGNLASKLDVRGSLAITDGKLVKRISLVPDLRSRGGHASQGIPLDAIRIPDETWGAKVRYDVELRTVKPFVIAMHVVETPINVNARLRGTGSAPYLDGTATTRNGRIRLPAMGMKLDQAVLTFSDDRPSFPRLFAVASGRRLGVDVLATLDGPIDRTEISLTSTPALSSEDLTLLISTGRLPDDLRERGIQSQAALVGTYLAQELLDFYLGSDSTDRNESFVDRFSFESGREVSRNGVETLTVEFDLREGFFLQAERDMYEDFNMGVLYRFRF